MIYILWMGKRDVVFGLKMYRTRPLDFDTVSVSQGLYGGEMVFQENGIFFML